MALVPHARHFRYAGFQHVGRAPGIGASSSAPFPGRVALSGTSVLPEINAFSGINALSSISALPGFFRASAALGPYLAGHFRYVG